MDGPGSIMEIYFRGKGCEGEFLRAKARWDSFHGCDLTSGALAVVESY